MYDLANINNPEKQLKSRQRVADHGEVFTAEREVIAMMDLVKDESYRIDSRFLEPACGTGNFLVEILKRKLKTVNEMYSRNQCDYEKNALIAISNIYGIDILIDNVREARESLEQIVYDNYKALYPAFQNESFLNTVKFIIKHNIIWGDTLKMTIVKDAKRHIIFTDWIFFDDNLPQRFLVKRIEYKMKSLLSKKSNHNDGIFSEISDEDLKPKPYKEFPLEIYLHLGDKYGNKT